jgi:hypothetical protein
MKRIYFIALLLLISWESFPQNCNLTYNLNFNFGGTDFSFCFLKRIYLNDSTFIQAKDWKLHIGNMKFQNDTDTFIIRGNSWFYKHNGAYYKLFDEKKDTVIIYRSNIVYSSCSETLFPNDTINIKCNNNILMTPYKDFISDVKSYLISKKDSNNKNCFPQYIINFEPIFGIISYCRSEEDYLKKTSKYLYISNLRIDCPDNNKIIENIRNKYKIK